MEKASVFILGLGRSGISTALFCQTNGIPALAWDDDEAVRHKASAQGIALACAPAWEQVQYVLLSPGLPPQRTAELRHKAQQHQCIVTCDIGFFFKLFPHHKMLAITGTNGKSTTCSLIAHILRHHQILCRLAGNIGVPIFEQLAQSESDPCYVLELSSYQLELCQHLPWTLQAGGILNITPHHLERHETLAHYQNIKAGLLAHSIHKFAGEGCPNLEKLCKHYPDLGILKHRSSRLNWHHTLSFDQDGLYLFKDGASHTLPFLRPVSSPALQQNIAMAYAILQCVPDALQEFSQAITTFSGLPHRQELIYQSPTLQCINDSKATTPEAVLQALEAWSAPIHWIAGGVRQEDDLSVLIPALKQVGKAYVCGEASKRYGDFLSEHHIPWEAYASLKLATQAAWSEANRTGGTVLCSPGCASFDQFKNFVERGQAFHDEILELIPKTTEQRKEPHPHG